MKTEKTKIKIMRDVVLNIVKKPAIINLDLEDFDDLTEIISYNKYRVSKSILAFEPKLDIIKFNPISKMIIVITSGLECTIKELENIIKQIKDIFNDPVDVILGHKMYEELKDFEVDLFLYK